MGNEEYKAKNYTKAIEHYTRAIQLSAEKECSVFFCNRAACHLALGNFAAVIEDCTSALAIDGAYIKALFRRGQAYEQLQDYKNALYDFTTICLMKKFEEREYMMAVDRVLRVYGSKLATEHAANRTASLPGAYSIHSYMESFHDLSPETSPLVDLQILIDEDRENGVLHYRLAKALYHQGVYDSVLETVTTAVSLLDAAASKGETQAELIDALELQGTFHHLRNEAPRAVACFDRILALHPDHLNAMLRRATTMLEQGNPTSALEGFNTAVRLAPTDPLVYYHRAQCHLIKEDVVSAIPDFEKSVQLKPNFPAPFIQLALAKAKTGDVPSAKKYFDDAAALFPKSADVDTFRAQFLLQLGDVEGAQRLLAAAETKDRTCPLPAFFNAQIAMQTQDFATCVRELERAVVIDPKFDTAYQQLAQLHMQARNMPRALECFDKVIEYTRTNDDLTTAFACREAALAQQHVLALNADLRQIVESMGAPSP